MPIITAKDISMSYEGRTVIENVNFSISAGDYLCILGENGSGKTTLLKALTGLKKIDSGSLEFGEGLRRRDIGYLPQQTDFQKDFPASVSEVVMSGCINSMRFKPFYTKREKNMAKKAMSILDILSISDKCYHELSGGQQQKVLLARALCASKKLLILDEPATGLDSGASAELYSLISKLNSEGMTIIMISHDIANSVRYADYILHLGDGGSSFFGTCDEYTDMIGEASE